MEIRIRKTGQVMYESEFRAHIASNGGPTWGTTTDEILDSLGADVVFEGPQATGGTVYQYSMRQGVEQIEGEWYTKYVLGPIFTNTTAEDGTVITAAQHEAAYKAQKDTDKAKAVRNERNSLLAATDWTQCKDIPDETSSEWAIYRQALRDVPEQSGFPWNVVWPTKPSS
jgi:hypothetical protein